MRFKHNLYKVLREGHKGNYHNQNCFTNTLDVVRVGDIESPGGRHHGTSGFGKGTVKTREERAES
jgi:hypothetical protein